MVINIIAALQQLAPDVEDAFVNALNNAGLNKSGNLGASVKATVVQVNDEYQLQTHMLDYGLYLDQKHEFIDKAINSIKDQVEQNVQQAAEADIANSLNQIFQH